MINISITETAGKVELNCDLLVICLLFSLIVTETTTVNRCDNSLKYISITVSAGKND